MFTTVYDDAVTRYTLPDGTEVAFGVDEAPSNPVEEFDYPIGIECMERGSITTDPEGLLGLHDRLRDALAECDYLLDEKVMSLDDALDPADEGILREYEDITEQLERLAYMEWTDTNEYGHPTYRVAYRPADMISAGWSADRLPEIVEGMAREYSAWAQGTVYVMGVETPGSTEVYRGMHYGMDPYDIDQVAEELRVEGINPAGITQA